MVKFMEKKELLEKARQTNSPEELLALAKENNYPMSEEEAKDYFEKLHKSGELSDDELDNVAGGGCGPSCPFCGTSLPDFNPNMFNICPKCKKIVPIDKV